MYICTHHVRARGATSLAFPVTCGILDGPFGDRSGAVREPFGSLSETILGFQYQTRTSAMGSTVRRPCLPSPLYVYARDALFFDSADVQMLGLSVRYLFRFDRGSRLSNSFGEHLLFCFLCCVFFVLHGRLHMSPMQSRLNTCYCRCKLWLLWSRLSRSTPSSSGRSFARPSRKT